MRLVSPAKELGNNESTNLVCICLYGIVATTFLSHVATSSLDVIFVYALIPGCGDISCTSDHSLAAPGFGGVSLRQPLISWQAIFTNVS